MIETRRLNLAEMIVLFRVFRIERRTVVVVIQNRLICLGLGIELWRWSIFVLERRRLSAIPFEEIGLKRRQKRSL